jgi:hypothetical protein
MTLTERARSNFGFLKLLYAFTRKRTERKKDENMNEKANKTANTENESTEAQGREEKKVRPESSLEFKLVHYMLISLTTLIIILVVLPSFVKGSDDQKKELIEYSKWVLTALLAAFGAWIGAGAAYFFGKENLRLNNESTEAALRIQKDPTKARSESALVKDINLTPFDPSFKFSLDTKVQAVLDELGQNVDYWFVPIVENEKLKDTVHTEAFWRYCRDEAEKGQKEKKAEPKVKDVIEYIDANAELKQKKNKLHRFFLEVAMGDSVSDISDKMHKRDASVGVVCDKDGKPTHCFSRKDLRSFQLGGN